MFDIHTHILPNIDDGAENVEESLRLIEMLKSHGVTAVAATPHFYAEVIAFDEYHAKAEESFELLKSRLDDESIKLVKGYEVRYFRGISQTDNISKLTLGGSKYILVEFPYGQDITDRVVDEIADITYNCGITPVLAHLERYHKYHGFKKAVGLVDNGLAMAHINSSSLQDGYKRCALNLIESGVATLMATDTHSVLTRPPMINEATKVIAKNLGEAVVEKLFENSNRIYKDITNKV